MANDTAAEKSSSVTVSAMVNGATTVGLSAQSVKKIKINRWLT